MTMHRLCSLLLLLILGTPLFLYGQPAPPSSLDAYVASVMEAFEVPGISLAIVKDGEVVVTRGFGVREKGKPVPVDAQTLFGIASNTKAFTATALALLVEEGRLAWDAPVIAYLPGFQMWDPYVTRELTVRDLLVHRSGLGLGAGDLLWWPPSTYDRKEIVRRLRYIEPVASFRSAYAYDNVLYSVAGEVIEAVSGQPWETFVEARILAPVGMDGSNVRHAIHGEGSATPHARINGKVRAIAPFASDNVNPAGGINSNAEDIAKWMIVQLDSGRVAPDRRLFSPATTRQLWSIVTPMPIGNPAPELAPLRTNFRGYALGFEVRDYRGYKLVTHTGGLPGFVSRIALIPDLKLGVAVFTNQESGAAFNAVTYHILDHYLGAAPHDWLGAYRALQARFEAETAQAESETAAARDATSKPSLPLASYAGTYVDAWYGDVEITQENDGLVIRFTRSPSLLGDLEHWQYDTFVARWRDRELRADAFVTFSLTPEGTIDQVKLKAVSRATDFSYDFHDLRLKPDKF